MNPRQTPSLKQINEFLYLPKVLNNIIYEYFGNPFISTWNIPDDCKIKLPINEYNMSKSALLLFDNRDLRNNHDYEQEPVDNEDMSNPLQYNFIADWGDGSSSHITSYNDAGIEHIYSKPGVYTIHINGLITGLRFGDFRWTSDESQCKRILDISQWGCINISSGYKLLAGCENINISASDSLNLKNVTDISYMFMECNSLNCDLNWDTKNITNMGFMFYGCISFNGDISNWDTKNVEITKQMFKLCVSFNGHLNKWKTNNIKDMSRMFDDCISFNSDISSWNVENVINIDGIFRNCAKFNCCLKNWDISNTLNNKNMLDGCESFDFENNFFAVQI